MAECSLLFTNISQVESKTGFIGHSLGLGVPLSLASAGSQARADIMKDTFSIDFPMLCARCVHKRPQHYITGKVRDLFSHIGATDK